MRFKRYLTEKVCPPGFFFSKQNGKCMPEGRNFDQGILTTELTKQQTYVTKAEATDFINRWKSKLKSYGVTEVEFSNHFLLDRLNHARNIPSISVKEMDFVLEGFLRKMGSQFKKDVENIKNHTAKRRGVNKKQLKENELEFAVTSNSTNIKFVFVLKQDFHKKGTAVVLPITIIRKKQFKVIKGEQVMVERREL